MITDYRTFRVNPEETEKLLIYDLGNRQWDIPGLRKLLEDILPMKSSFEDFEVEHDFKSIGRKTMMLNTRKIYREMNNVEMILLAIEDITDYLNSKKKETSVWFWSNRDNYCFDNCYSSVWRIKIAGNGQGHRRGDKKL